MTVEKRLILTDSQIKIRISKNDTTGDQALIRNVKRNTCYLLEICDNLYAQTIPAGMKNLRRRRLS